MNTEWQRKLIVIVHGSFLILGLGLKAVHAGQLVQGGPELPAIGVRELGVGQYVRIEDGGQLTEKQLREAIFSDPESSLKALYAEMSYGALELSEAFIVSMGPAEIYPPEGACHPGQSNILIDVDEALEPNPDWFSVDHFLGVIHPDGACNFNVGSSGHESVWIVEDPNNVYDVTLNGGASYFDGIYVPLARSTAKPRYIESSETNSFGNPVFLDPSDSSTRIYLCELDGVGDAVSDMGPIGSDPSSTRCEVISETDALRCVKRTEDTLAADASLCVVGKELVPDFAYVSNSTYAHEVMHGYFPLHANAWRCTAENPISSNPADCGQTGPHQHDIMGSGGRVAGTHLNAHFKDYLGWIPPLSKVDLTEPGVYDVEIFDLAQPAPTANDKLMVEISLTTPIPAQAPNGSPFEFDTLTIEFRGHTGFDTRERNFRNYETPLPTGETRRNLADDFNQFGALIQLLRCTDLPYDWSPCIPYEVDMTPGSIAALGLAMSESSENFYDSGDGYLQAGQSVSVPGNGITIEVLDTMNAPASISVRVTVESSDVPAVPGLNRALIALLTIVTVATASFGLGPNKKRA